MSFSDLSLHIHTLTQFMRYFLLIMFNETNICSNLSSAKKGKCDRLRYYAIHHNSSNSTTSISHFAKTIFISFPINLFRTYHRMFKAYILDENIRSLNFFVYSYVALPSCSFMYMRQLPKLNISVGILHNFIGVLSTLLCKKFMQDSIRQRSNVQKLTFDELILIYILTYF